MRILIVFGSTEGHTRKLAGFVAGELTAAGHEVVLHSAHDAPAEPDPAEFQRVILMGSLHAGRYQAPLVRYAQAHVAHLRSVPSAFVSVSLSAAGHDARDWGGLAACLERFEQETGWRPQTTHHAAGAFVFTRYGWLTRLVMRRIARRRGLQLEAGRDYDLTDYPALAGFARDFAGAGSVAA